VIAAPYLIARFAFQQLSSESEEKLCEMWRIGWITTLIANDIQRPFVL
jgi:hypothetical protein